jgi:hypothetical protein
MAAGMFLIVCAFAISAVLESQMQSSSAAKNLKDQIKLINLSPCQLNITINDNIGFVLEKPILKNNEFKIPKEQLDAMFKDSRATFNIKPSLCVSPSDNTININVPNLSIQIDNALLPKSLLFYYDENIGILNLKQYSYQTTDQVIGKSEIKVSYIGRKPVGVLLESSKIKYNITSLEDLNQPTIPISKVNYISVDYTDYTLKAQTDTENFTSSSFELETCGRYTVVLFENPLKQKKMDYVLLTDVLPNGLSLFLQLIQIFVLTCGEVMFSISGINFFNLMINTLWH